MKPIHEERPVSRVWACVFSFSIFAILWTNKMKKTRKWVVLFSILVVVQVGDIMLYPMDDWYSDWWFQYPNPYIEELLLNVVSDDASYATSLVLTVVWDWVVWIGILFAMIYYMFKWTTRYNLENFGYKSKREWKGANPTEKNIEDIITNAGKKTATNLKDFGKKTADKIPSEKIKDAGSSVADKVTKAAEMSRKQSHDQTIKEIEKYHNLLLRGIISESDFERKKSQLLGLDDDKLV